ncbi:MAG: hypothetical protein OEL83_12215 [Desulforhopalus sp.]|nr:hypothetical protein [Desulforhopalus sp.]
MHQLLPLTLLVGKNTGLMVNAELSSLSAQTKRMPIREKEYIQGFKPFLGKSKIAKTSRSATQSPVYHNEIWKSIKLSNTSQYWVDKLISGNALNR